MATKAEFMKAPDDLPDDATIDDAVERLVLHAGCRTRLGSGQKRLTDPAELKSLIL